jgi:hypothetical protein
MMRNFLNWNSSSFWHTSFHCQSQACRLVYVLIKDTSSDMRLVLINILELIRSNFQPPHVSFMSSAEGLPVPHFYVTRLCCIQNNLFELCSLNIFGSIEFFDTHFGFQGNKLAVPSAFQTLHVHWSNSAFVSYKNYVVKQIELATDITSSYISPQRFSKPSLLRLCIVPVVRKSTSVLETS